MTATLGVQEPFAGTIRFKWLVRLPTEEMAPFLDDPMGWIGERYGGGKFKVTTREGRLLNSTDLALKFEKPVVDAAPAPDAPVG